MPREEAKDDRKEKWASSVRTADLIDTGTGTVTI